MIPTVYHLANRHDPEVARCCGKPVASFDKHERETMFAGLVTCPEFQPSLYQKIDFLVQQYEAELSHGDDIATWDTETLKGVVADLKRILNEPRGITMASHIDKD